MTDAPTICFDLYEPRLCKYVNIRNRIEFQPLAKMLPICQGTIDLDLNFDNEWTEPFDHQSGYDCIHRTQAGSTNW